MFKWQGRIDSEDGIEGLRWHQKVNELEVGEDNSLANAVTLVGFESDLDGLELLLRSSFQALTAR